MMHKVIHNIISKYYPEKFEYSFFGKLVNHTLSEDILPSRTYVYLRIGERVCHYARIEYYQSHIKLYANGRFIIVNYSDPRFFDAIKRAICDSDST
jgi:hypothetical protein